MIQDHPEFIRFREIYDRLSERVVGQESAKRWLARVAAEHEAGLAPKEGRPRCVMLVGPTGSGKTQLVRALAELLEKPFCRIDASFLAPTSFKGTQIHAIFEMLEVDFDLRDLEGESNLAAGVVMIDEIDKIAFNPKTRRNDVQERHFEQVQNVLLPLFEGKQISSEGRVFDASKILLISAGAFLQEEIKESVKQRCSLAPSDYEDVHRFLEHEDLIRFGFLPELVGRVRGIAALSELEETELGRVLLSEVRETGGKVFGCRLVIDEDALPVLSRYILDRNLGARASAIVIEEIKHAIYSTPERFDLDESKEEIRVTLEFAKSLANQQI